MKSCKNCLNNYIDGQVCTDCKAFPTLEPPTNWRPLTDKRTSSLTHIEKIKGDWEEVVNDCRGTIGKGELGREPSRQFKEKILLTEHSPIRDLSVRWKWPGMPHWVSVHWVRHKWEKFVRTQRSDRTGIPRDKLPQDAPTDFTGEANSQHLIDTWRKRLCYQASPETRKYAEDFKTALYGVQEELSNVLVPNCVYRGGCPEMKACGFWVQFANWADKQMPRAYWFDNLSRRYELYNHYFYLTGGNEHEAGK